MDNGVQTLSVVPSGGPPMRGVYRGRGGPPGRGGFESRGG